MGKNGSAGGFAKALLGIVFGTVTLVAGTFLYLKFGPPPVAVADSPFPYERQIVKIPLRARIAREMKDPPFQASEEVFASGARIYKDQCAVCHGTPGHDAVYASHMYPPPPQLWKKHGPRGTVGVSDEEPGFSYWFVANGVRLSGMPSFHQVLSDTEMWQVSLLLKNAGQERTAPVTGILGGPTP